MENTDYGPNGQWDEYQLTIAGGAALGSEETASPSNNYAGTTVPDCTGAPAVTGVEPEDDDQGTNDGNSYAFLWTVFDDSSGSLELTDCGFIGPNSKEYFEDYVSGEPGYSEIASGCLCWDDDGECTSDSGYSIPPDN